MNNGTATEQLRQAIASHAKPARAAWARHCREVLGMSKRHAEAYAAALVRVQLVADDPEADTTERLAALLTQLAGRLRNG